MNPVNRVFYHIVYRVSKTTPLWLAIIFDTHQPILIFSVDNKVVLLCTVCKYYFSSNHFCVTALLQKLIGLLYYAKGTCLLVAYVIWLWKEPVDYDKCSKWRPLSCTQPYSALVNGFVDDTLWDTRRCFNGALLQDVGVADWRLIHALLHPTPDLLVDRV